MELTRETMRNEFDTLRSSVKEEVLSAAEKSITLEKDGTTLITGPVTDDAALHGLLKRVRDSGLRLLSVNQIESSQAGKKVSED